MANPWLFFSLGTEKTCRELKKKKKGITAFLRVHMALNDIILLTLLLEIGTV